MAEAWLPSLDRTARYVRPGELHQAFNFEFLGAAWSAPGYRRVIDASLRRHGRGRRARDLGDVQSRRRPARLPAGGRRRWHRRRCRCGGGATALADPALGLRRARAATLLMLALPGSVYLYQGEELGLPEVFDLPGRGPAGSDLRPDRRGRARSRRLPGAAAVVGGAAAPYGFGPAGSVPWLPQPAAWSALSVEAQADDPASTLALYRTALRLRRAYPGLGDGPLVWRSSPDDAVLVFERPGGPDGVTVVCAVNQGSEPVAAVDGRAARGQRSADRRYLPPDTAAWWAIR